MSPATQLLGRGRLARTARGAALSLTAAALIGSAHLVGAADAPDARFLTHPDNVPAPAKRGGKLVVALHVPMTHPIGTVASGFRNIPGAQVNASLLNYGDSYEPLPYLATSWSFSDDGKRFDFELHPEARFHDGEDVTCTDVGFSIETSKANHPFKPMFRPVVAVEGGDTKSCSIILSQPHPALLTALSPGLLPVIPEHIYNDGQDMQTHPRLTQDVIGAGPFKLVSWDGKDKAEFVRNEDFFIAGLPYLDEIVMDIVPDRATMTLGLESGAYDMVSVWDGDDITAAQNNPNLKVIDKGFEAIGGIPWIQLNLRDPVIADVRIRKALAYGYDFEQFNEIIFAGQHRQQCSAIHSQSKFYNPASECYNLDVEKAKALLADAGYPDGIDLTLSVQSEFLDRAEVLKQQWGKIGVNLEVKVAPDEVTMLGQITKKDADFQISLVGLWNWGDPVIGVNRSYNCDNRKVGVAFSNMSWYCNEEVDALLEQAAYELDEEKRAEIYFEATDMINDDVPVIYLSNEVFYTRMQPSVMNPPDGIWGWMAPWSEIYIDK